MDILEKNSLLNDLFGIVISKLEYMDKGVYYKVLTRKYGYIEIFSRGIKSDLLPFSKYSFKLKEQNSAYTYLESYILKYNRYTNKEEILAINYISEVINKTMLSGEKSAEIFDLLDYFLEHLEKENYLNLLIYFIILFLKYSGYYIDLSNIDFKNSKYYFDIIDCVFVNYEEYSKNYVYILSVEDLEIIKSIYENSFDKDFKFDRKKIRRLIGVFTNLLCLHFSVKELNSFKFI